MELYLNFKDQSAAAMAFYGEIFHTQPTGVLHFGDMPADPAHPIPDAVKPLVMNASMPIDGTVVMFSDSPAGMGPDLKVGNNFALVLQPETEEETRRLFEALSADGQVLMPLAKTFWAKLYANFTDKFGVGWQISYGQVQQ